MAASDSPWVRPDPVGPLSLQDADRLGIGDRELRGPTYQRLTRGLYGMAEQDPADVRLRLSTVVALLPESAALTGWASLFWQGVEDLDGGPDLRVHRVASRRRGRGVVPTPLTFTDRSAPIAVAIGPTGRMRPRADVDVSRRVLPPGDVVVVGGVPCVRADRALVDLMGVQPAEEALVSLDAVLRTGITDAGRVARYLADHATVRGAARIRKVLPMGDAAARSCPETRLRWIWVVEAGLPPPRVNVAVEDRQGRLLGIPDLLDEESGLVGEYDGSQHRELANHADDNAREERFERSNLVVARATSLDIYRRRPQLVARLRSAYAAGLARDRRRDEWRTRPGARPS